MPDGSLVFLAGEGPLVRIDFCNKIEWTINREFHHSIERDHQGNLVVPIVIALASQTLTIPFRDDGYAVVSPEGDILEEHSVATILKQNGFEGLLTGVGLFEDDRIHLNDAQPVHRTTEEARVGDLAFSIRNLSTVCLYRPTTSKIVWLKTGPWLVQHDINLLSEGAYSIFGNDAIRHSDGLTRRADISQVYIFEPSTGNIRTPYSKMLRDIKMFSDTEGRSRVLDNGDVFIEATGGAQLYRISADKVRWSFENLLTDTTIGSIHWSRYLPASEIDLSWLENINCK